MRISDHLEILADSAWKHPQYYSGFSPDGDYLIASKHRESEILSQSNFQVALRILTDAISANPGCPDCPEERDEHGYIIRPDWVYAWTARCSMVGWIDYLMVRKDAPESVLRESADIVASLADYPVLDDEHYSESQLCAVESYWENASMRERIEHCKDAGVSIFAARDAHPSGELLSHMLDLEMFY